MKAPGFWSQPAGVVSTVLSPLSWAYGAIAGWRMSRRGFVADVPVICVGNFTLGGAGKTPVALAVARILIAAGERPVFLSRGYGGRMRGPVVVAGQDAVEVGDEPLLLARLAPVVVSRDRVVGARLAQAQGASVIVMDDGFHNPHLAKSLSLVVVDAARGLGNGQVFPAGPLRASLDVQIELADALVVVGEGNGAEDIVAEAGLPVFRARLRAQAHKLQGVRVLAFAGIAYPDKFFSMLESVGADVVMRRGYDDHHRFRQAEVAELVDLARQHDLVPVTTEKDMVRLQGFSELIQMTQVLSVTAEFENVGRVQDFLMRSGCRRSSTASGEA